MPREKVICPCGKYHKNRFVHPTTRRKHLLECNRLDLLDKPNNRSLGTSPASKTIHPSNIPSHTLSGDRDGTDGPLEPMEIDGEQHSYHEEEMDDVDESGEGNSSSNEEDDGDHRSAILSSDEGSDGSEESELEETRDMNGEDSGYNAELVSDDERLQKWIDDLDTLARMQRKPTSFITLLKPDATPGADWKSTYSFFHYKSLTLSFC